MHSSGKDFRDLIPEILKNFSGTDFPAKKHSGGQVFVADCVKFQKGFKNNKEK